MYPRSLITVSLCILKNWPFCSAETDTGAVAPVEATQVGAEGQAEVVGPTKPFSYYMSQWDTRLPQHNMTRLNCSPCNATLQNYCLSLHHFTSQESHRDQVLPHHPCVHQGFGQDSFKSCYSQGAGSYHQSFLNPDISPHIISYHIALHLPWENGITAQKYPWHPPDCTELSLLAQQDGADTEITCVCCDRPLRSPEGGQASLVPWRGPWEGPVSRGYQSLCWSRQKLPLSWRTSSSCRAEAQPADSRTEVHMPRADHGVWFHSPHPWIQGSQEACSLLSPCLVGKLGHLQSNCRWVSF